MNAQALAYLMASPLNPLLQDEGITDISFNGTRLFYQHNTLGRQAASFAFSAEAALSLIRQLANLAEMSFSYASPILDVSIGSFRINAVHPALARTGYERTVTFSIRKSSDDVAGFIEEASFISSEGYALMMDLLKQRRSIVIAGTTGCGKTSLQKYLLSHLPKASRVLIIDNVQELGYLAEPDIDFNIWQMNPEVKQGSFEALIANALRANPDWLIVAEARGREMYDVLMASMTGHPVITTLHSLDALSVYRRMASMIRMGHPEIPMITAIADAGYFFPLVIYLSMSAKTGGQIHRYVSGILEMRQGHLVWLYRADPG